MRIVLLLCALFIAAAAPELPGEMPKDFRLSTDSFDYVRRAVMIPMRDGVKLRTVMLIPLGAQHAPMLLTRTPYGADARLPESKSAHMADVIGVSDPAAEAVLQGGYIRVVQDVRGKHGSEGDYVMNRPLIGPQNPSNVDYSTDTYDTIDWLVKNVPESNGRVGIIGISYDGFTSLMALVHPHPALRVAVPINPMVDGWMGDDWFHMGAFRTGSLGYIYEQEATRGSDLTWWSDKYDDYDAWLTGSAGDIAKSHGLDQLGFWNKIAAHPEYDAFWQDQAVDKLLADQPLTVPTMLVHSLWDQEDIYGAIHVYRAIKPNDTDNDKVFLVMGPWFHHQQRLDGSAIGPIRFGADTALEFRTLILKPFLDQYLKDDAPAAGTAPVTAFETGTNHWNRLTAWPAGCVDGCRIETRPLYMQAGGKLSFGLPADAKETSDTYTSDPAKPVPFLPRPVHLEGDAGEHAWQTWLVSDQRDVASRPDVLSFTSDVLKEPLKIAGEPVADLLAATTGTDGDFVVKLIDVYPDEVGNDPAMGGYELMVSADIMRGRYRQSFEVSRAIAANQKLEYKFALPTINHVFLPGHRIMVQVQSSWFPLYDRNPQTFVDNIFWAKPGDYKKADVTIFEGGMNGSSVKVPVVIDMK